MDRPDKLRMVHPDLANDEKSGSDAFLLQLLEEPISHADHSVAVIVLDIGIHVQSRRRLDSVVFLDIETDDGRERVKPSE
jgi:hypothetical protein